MTVFLRGRPALIGYWPYEMKLCGIVPLSDKRFVHITVNKGKEATDNGKRHDRMTSKIRSSCTICSCTPKKQQHKTQKKNRPRHKIWRITLTACHCGELSVMPCMWLIHLAVEGISKFGVVKLRRLHK
jgi:hypothetical protein